MHIPAVSYSVLMTFVAWESRCQHHTNHGGGFSNCFPTKRRNDGDTTFAGLLLPWHCIDAMPHGSKTTGPKNTRRWRGREGKNNGQEGSGGWIIAKHLQAKYGHGKLLYGCNLYLLKNIRLKSRERSENNLLKPKRNWHEFGTISSVMLCIVLICSHRI